MTWCSLPASSAPLRSARARVVSAAGEGNGDAPADQFMRGVIDCAAQYERGIIRARTKAALAAKSAKGERVSGGIPYGFALAADGVHLVPVGGEQATIALARQLVVDGRSPRAVAVGLLAQGHVARNGRPFAAVQVARILASAEAHRSAA